MYLCERVVGDETGKVVGTWSWKDLAKEFGLNSWLLEGIQGFPRNWSYDEV